MPYGPSGIVGALSAGGDSSGSNFLDKAEFIAETIAGGGVTSFQEGCMGKRAFMTVRKLVSERANRREQQSASWLVSPAVKHGVNENGVARRRVAKV